MPMLLCEARNETGKPMISRAATAALLSVALGVLLSASMARAEEDERISCSFCHGETYKLEIVAANWADSACDESANGFKINKQPAPLALAAAGTKALDARRITARVLALLAKEHDVPVNPEMRKVMVPVIKKGKIEEEEQTVAVGELNREFDAAAAELDTLLDSPVADSAGVIDAVDALDAVALSLQKIYLKARAVRTGIGERAIFGIVLLAFLALLLAALVGRSALARGNVVEGMLSEEGTEEGAEEEKPEKPPES